MGFIALVAAVRHGMISPEDLKPFSFVDDPARALGLLQKGLRAQPEETPPACAHSYTPQPQREAAEHPLF
jgi:hypothetical protein